MSRRIDDSRPYTDEEKEYLLTRSGGEAKIAINERRFAHLSDEQKKALTGRVDADNASDQAEEDEFNRQQEADEEEGYHPDDVEKVAPMKTAELREALEAEGLSSKVSAADKKDEGSDEDLTEKEVLAYRLLNRLDEKRNAASV